LSADAGDRSAKWPARYNFLEHQVYDDLAQQWFWNEKTGAIHNNATPNYFLQNDNGELQVGNTSASGASSKFPSSAGKWFWNGAKRQLETEVGDYTNVVGVFNSPKPNEYVKVGIDSMMNINARTHWRIEYCNQVELGTRQPNPNTPSSDAGVENIGKSIENNVHQPDHERVEIPVNTFGDANDISL